MSVRDKVVAASLGLSHHGRSLIFMYSTANLNYLVHAFVPQDIPFVYGGNISDMKDAHLI